MKGLVLEEYFGGSVLRVSSRRELALGFRIRPNMHGMHLTARRNAIWMCSAFLRAAPNTVIADFNTAACEEEHYPLGVDKDMKPRRETSTRFAVHWKDGSTVTAGELRLVGFEFSVMAVLRFRCTHFLLGSRCVLDTALDQIWSGRFCAISLQSLRAKIRS